MGMATPIGMTKFLRLLSRWRSLIISVSLSPPSIVSEKNEIGMVQGVLEVHPGRGRPNHAKDWTVANTSEIDWKKLTPFMKRHAKALDSYIKETFT